MDMEKLKQWLDLTKQYQQESFWDKIFEQDADTSTTNLGKNNPTPFRSKLDSHPICDVYEQNQFLYLEAELPGLSPNEIQVKLHHRTIILSGEYRTIKPSLQYFLKERTSRRFEKEISLPYAVITNEIRHFFQNGVLTLVMPIKQNEPDDDKISIPIDPL